MEGWPKALAKDPAPFEKRYHEPKIDTDDIVILHCKFLDCLRSVYNSIFILFPELCFYCCSKQCIFSFLFFGFSIPTSYLGCCRYTLVWSFCCYSLPWRGPSCLCRAIFHFFNFFWWWRASLWELSFQSLHYHFKFEFQIIQVDQTGVLHGRLM